MVGKQGDALKEKKGHHHGVIESRIGRKPQKRQLLKVEVLQPAMHQFIRPPAMLAGNDALRLQIMLPAHRGQALINGLSHSQVGIKDGQRPHLIQQPLPAVCHRPAQKGPAKHLPSTPVVTQFQIIPDLLARCYLQLLGSAGFCVHLIS